MARIDFDGLQVGAVNPDCDRLLAADLDDVGGRQIVQVHNVISRPGIRHILGLLHEVEVQLFDEVVR